MKQTARVHRAEEGSYIRSERSLLDEVAGKSEVTLFVRRLRFIVKEKRTMRLLVDADRSMRYTTVIIILQKANL